MISLESLQIVTIGYMLLQLSLHGQLLWLILFSVFLMNDDLYQPPIIHTDLLILSYQKY